MYIQAIVSPRDVRVTNGSMQSSSRWVNCHSASSVNSSFFKTTPSALMSSIIAYVGVGGIKASLAAMRAGHGGQQKIPHSRLRAFQVALLPPLLILPKLPMFTSRDTVVNTQFTGRTGNIFTDVFSAFTQRRKMHNQNRSIDNSKAIES